MMNLDTLRMLLNLSNIHFLLYTMPEEKHIKYILNRLKTQHQKETILAKLKLNRYVILLIKSKLNLFDEAF